MLIVREGTWLEADELQPVCRQEAGGSAGPHQMLLYKGRLFGDVAFSHVGCCVGMWEVLSMQFGGSLGLLPLLTQYLVPFCLISSCLINSFFISDPVGAIFCLFITEHHSVSYLVEL